jgi:hypothetical protein
VTKLLGREHELTMTLTAFEPNRRVLYRSTHADLPDVIHERHFEPDGSGFVYRLVVEYEPRGGIAGLFDRLMLARGIRRAFHRTFAALDKQLR